MHKSIHLYVGFDEGGCQDVGSIALDGFTLVDSEELQALKDRATQAEAQHLALAAKLLAVSREITGIVNDSQGVAGYHLNGAVATWDEFDLSKALHAKPEDCLKEHVRYNSELMLRQFVDYVNDLCEQLDYARIQFLEQRND